MKQMTESKPKQKMRPKSERIIKSKLKIRRGGLGSTSTKLISLGLVLAGFGNGSS